VMPDGPVILSPDRLIRSFKREVIHRQPQMFKIAALKNIRNLFPDEFNPFYTGFGNRDTDAVSYRAVGISLNRIFIVNHDGEIHHYNSTYKKSYPLLNELVDDMFPSKLFLKVKGEAESLIQGTIGPQSPTPKPVTLGHEQNI
jgi:phosphatidate phosphatase LPIN